MCNDIELKLISHGENSWENLAGSFWEYGPLLSFRVVSRVRISPVILVIQVISSLKVVALNNSGHPREILGAASGWFEVAVAGDLVDLVLEPPVEGPGEGMLD